MRQPANTLPGDADVATLREALESGAEFTKESARQRFGWGERRFRAIVAALRAQGYPLISRSEEGSTYKKAVDVRELDAFIDGELLPRIRKLDREARAMRTLGRNYFATTQQRLI